MPYRGEKPRAVEVHVVVTDCGDSSCGCSRICSLLRGGRGGGAPVHRMNAGMPLWSCRSPRCYRSSSSRWSSYASSSSSSPSLSSSLLFCWSLLVTFVVADSGEQNFCDIASSQCLLRMGCSMALNNYYIGCGALIHGRIERRCTPQCKKALVTLLSTEGGGRALISCDCNGNNFCKQQKERTQVCNAEVTSAMKSIANNSTQIGCTLAEMICRADTSCNTALGYYHRHCLKMFAGEKCTARCNNSLVILYRQAKARKLRNCVCDGDERWLMGKCPQIKHNTERLCLGHRHRHNHGNQRHYSHQDHEHSSTSGPVAQWNKDNRIAKDDEYKVKSPNSGTRCGVSSNYVVSLTLQLVTVLFFVSALTTRSHHHIRCSTAELSNT